MERPTINPLRPAQPPRLLLASEVAQLFRVDAKTITRWAQQGKLPYLRTLGGHRRYPEREVLAIRDRLASQDASQEVDQ